MTNPNDLVDAWVGALQRIAALVEALGSPDRIQGYKDRFPHDSNLRRAILKQPHGSLLVVYMGTGKVRAGAGGAWNFVHRFAIIVKAPESVAPREGSKIYGSYADLWDLFVNGVPEESDLPLLNTEIHPSCDSMDREGPSSTRASLLVSPDGETIDYFQFDASLIEKGA